MNNNKSNGKLKKLIVGLLAAYLLISAVGCGSTDGGEITDGKGNTLRTVCSFENYDEIQQINWSKQFGRAEVNAAPEYVSEGKGSVLIQPFGNPDGKEAPVLTINTGKNAFKGSDYSKVTSVSLDFFNVSADSAVKIGITTENEDGSTASLPVKTVQLKSKVWTKAVYDFSTGIYNRLYNMKNVKSISVEFVDHRNSDQPYQPNSYYMDNLTVVDSDKEIAFGKVPLENEVLDFESVFDFLCIETGSIDGGLYDNGNFSVALEAREGFYTNGKAGMRSKGYGYIKILSAILDESVIEKAQSLSFDALLLGQEVAEVELIVACKYDKIFEFSEIVECKENKWYNVSIDASDLGDYKFSDMEYIKIIVHSEQAWIDNIYFKVGE